MSTMPRAQAYDPRRAAAAAAVVERDRPRCGVCDQPSADPLCRKCRAVIGRRGDAPVEALPCPSCPGLLAHHVGPC